MEAFGKMFLEFCQESGYDKILHVLGATTTDFLQNLDALHDHLATIYPGMRAPSFRCTEREEDGCTILHYYSERPGLEYIVIGIVKAVAKTLHASEVDVEIIKNKGEDCDHVQFAIINRGNAINNTKAELEVYENTLSTEPKISPANFCRAFPFHIMFDRKMTIKQAGTSISRVIPHLLKGCKINELFEMVRPHMDFDFQHILSHINTVYVIRTSEIIFNSQNHVIEKDSVANNGRSLLRLKGQMLYVAESDLVLYLCSPSVMNLDDLNRLGLYLSDIPLHDATRDLVLLSEHFEAEYKLMQNLEQLTENLQQTYRDLAREKAKTDR